MYSSTASITERNKIIKLYSLEYTDMPKVIFMPHYIGHCCTTEIQSYCCILGHSCTNVITGYCCTTMRTLGSHCYTKGSNGWNPWIPLHHCCKSCKRVNVSIRCPSLVMEVVTSSETINIYQATQCYILQDKQLHARHHEKLKSHYSVLSFKILPFKILCNTHENL